MPLRLKNRPLGLPGAFTTESTKLRCAAIRVLHEAGWTEVDIAKVLRWKVTAVRAGITGKQWSPKKKAPGAAQMAPGAAVG